MIQIYILDFDILVAEIKIAEVEGRILLSLSQHICPINRPIPRTLVILRELLIISLD